MICPTCATHIPDGSLVCPACRARISAPAEPAEPAGRWCPSCGVLLGWEDEVCGSCGYPVGPAWDAPGAWGPEAGEEPAAGAPAPDEELVSETEDTRAIPRIESAIPAERDPESKVAAQEVMPARRSLVLAALASTLLICGAAFAITHPWNPDAFSIRATKEADTSMAGFPGTRESLTGQDSDAAKAPEELSGDDATFAQLSETYGQLADYAARADESERLFEEVGFGTDADERERGKREAEALAIDVSNLIETLLELDVTSGTYASDRDNLQTLGNWLRNRVDALVDAWTADVESADPAAERDRLQGLLEVDYNDEGLSAYKALFDENYATWEPKRVGE